MTPITAPLIGQTQVSIGPSESSEPIDTRLASTRFSRPFNVLGIPALALPCGLSAARMPIGLQLVTAPGKKICCSALARPLRMRRDSICNRESEIPQCLRDPQVSTCLRSVRTQDRFGADVNSASPRDRSWLREDPWCRRVPRRSWPCDTRRYEFRTGPIRGPGRARPNNERSFSKTAKDRGRRSISGFSGDLGFFAFGESLGFFRSGSESKFA